MLRYYSLQACVCLCVCKRMREAFVFFVSVCVWTRLLSCVLVSVCPHVCKLCAPTDTTHECKHTRTQTLALGQTCVVMATHTEINKRGIGVNIFSILSSRVQFISMQPWKATIYMKRELFLGNRGLSEGFDVSCLLLAWEWKSKPSREGERGASCKPTERAQFPHVVAALKVRKSLSPFPLNTLWEGRA